MLPSDMRSGRVSNYSSLKSRSSEYEAFLLSIKKGSEFGAFFIIK